MTRVGFCPTGVHTDRVSRYLIHARLFVGPLDAPTRNDVRTAEGDDLSAMEGLADELRELGWRVWLYERQPATAGSLSITGKKERLVVIREYREVSSARVVGT